MPVDLDVVVEVDPDLLPCGQFVVGRRERLELGPVPEVEEFPPRLPVLPHDPVVQLGKLLGHGRVEFFKGEEPPVPQGGQDPSLDVLDRHLGLGLVPGFSGAGWDDRHAVMLGQFLIRWIDVGVVTTGLGDAGLEVVRHQDGTDAAEVTEGPDMA